mmetsp:Transcript_7812/g.15503  ORF Transcript_7812/g.15503 Transcript_7812/m.15503 type:complete len:93 (-) Transcript_7812:1027-1305(-)
MNIFGLSWSPSPFSRTVSCGCRTEREERQMMVTAIALGGWTDASSTELESEDSVVFIPSFPPSLQKEACAPASNLELQLQLQVHVFKRGLPE